MTKRSLAAIFLDVGYTLVYDCPSYVDTCGEFIVSRNVEPDLDSMKRLAIETESALEQRLREPSQYCEDESIRAFWAVYFADLITAGAPSLRDDAYEIGSAVFDAYNPGPRWAVYPDVIEALSILHDSRFRLHVLSDWTSSLPEVLRAINLDHFFSGFHISTHMKLAKSGPEIYTAALRQSGLTASGVLMIGDSCARDVEIPKSIGMRAFFIDRSQKGPCQADATFPDLKTAAAYIREHYVPRE